jgi:hypothetical protein
MEIENMNKTLLAVRVTPWQLFRFKKIVEWKKSRPGIMMQEALQIYISGLNIPQKIMDAWLDEYHDIEKGKKS